MISAWWLIPAFLAGIFLALPILYGLDRLRSSIEGRWPSGDGGA